MLFVYQIGIGCVKEAYILLIFLVFTIVTSPLLSYREITNVMRYMFVTYPMVPGLLTLYVTLYYIYKCEGTLNVDRWHQKYKTQMFNASPKQSDFAIILTDETSSDRKQGNNKDDEMETKEANEEMEDISAMPFSCIEYLEDSDNYKIFSKYLAHCFALENILFVERVSVLYQIVLDLKEKNGESRNRILSLSPSGYSSNNNSLNRQRRTPTSTTATTPSPKHNLQRSKFEYSVELYFEFHKKIDRFNEKHRKNAEMMGIIGTVGYYKKILWKLHRDIYKEFVKNGSKYEINISSEIRSELVFLFGDNKNMYKFDTFDDFLSVFDNALIQVYEMIFSIYNYQFKKYLKNQNQNVIE